MTRLPMLLAFLLVAACSGEDPGTPPVEAAETSPEVPAAEPSEGAAAPAEEESKSGPGNPITHVLDKLGDARRGKAKADLAMLNQAITQFAINNRGKYPDSLDSLTETMPSGKSFLSNVETLVDPWDRPYLYEKGEGIEGVRIYTLGKDGEPGGEGLDLDIDQGMVIRGDV